jgi:integrase/recombinase XerD
MLDPKESFMERFFKDPHAILCKRKGPLGLYMDELAQHFAEKGYSYGYVRRQLRLASEFGSWVQRQNVALAELGSDHPQKFLRYRARFRKPWKGDLAACKSVYDLLRQKGVIAPPPIPKRSPVGRLTDEFSLYLRQERRLASTTVSRYTELVEDWLSDRFGSQQVNLQRLSTKEIIRYIQRRAPDMARKCAKVMITALRSFLQYARYRGYIELDLAASIPPIADWSRRSIPRSLAPEHVRQVLACCNRRTRMGRRDYAILLLLARLGLRGGEVASLTLDDIDWQSGTITVHGKRGREDALPLPSDVGRALVDYLKRGRPHSLNRCVFLRSRAPVASFKDQRSVGTVVRHALKRAGIDSPQKGAHQFRHALASEMLRSGASLGEIGELLRHRHPQTTTIYAKVDLASLRALALPWPGGGR